MKIRGMNKKAQEVVSNFGTVGIISIIFLVLVVLGIWYFSERGSEIGGQIPENAEVIAQACGVVAKESTINSYCLQFREVKTNTYVTCDKLSLYNIPVTDSDGAFANMNTKCNQYSENIEAKIKEACTTGDYKNKPTVEINGKKCSEYTSSLKCVNDVKGTTYKQVVACTTEPVLNSESLCKAQQGCTWDITTTPSKPVCTGTVTQCSDLSLDKCKNQLGCIIE
jgi:hypothetical protein